MGCYISPEDALTIEDIVLAIDRWSRGGELLVSGNFNADLENPEGSACAEDISASLTSSGTYMVITRYQLPQNNGNLPLPFFAGN